MTHDLKILRLIKIIPPIIVIIFAILVNVIVINNNQTKLNKDIVSLRQDFIKKNKNRQNIKLNKFFNKSITKKVTPKGY